MESEVKSKHGTAYFNFCQMFAGKNFINAGTKEQIYKYIVFFRYWKEKKFPECLNENPDLLIEENSKQRKFVSELEEKHLLHRKKEEAETPIA